MATTLVFVIAATGNYANYVSYKKKHSGSSSTLTVWYSNVDKVHAHAGHASAAAQLHVMVIASDRSVQPTECRALYHAVLGF